MLGRIVQKCDMHFGLVSSFKRLRNKMKDDINFLLVLQLIDNKMWIKLLDWVGQACAKRNQNYSSLLISFLFCESKTKITERHYYVVHWKSNCDRTTGHRTMELYCFWSWFLQPSLVWLRITLIYCWNAWQLLLEDQGGSSRMRKTARNYG